MAKDPRKNLDIRYNSLNLLSEVKQSSSIKAKYIYAADRTRLAVSDTNNDGNYYYTWKVLKGEDIFVNGIELPKLSTDFSSHIQRGLDHGMTGFSQVPLPGTCAGISYELGKEYGPSKWFLRRKNTTKHD